MVALPSVPTRLSKPLFLAFLVIAAFLSLSCIHDIPRMAPTRYNNSTFASNFLGTAFDISIDTAAANMTDVEPVTGPKPRYKHPIMILQHDCQCRAGKMQDLFDISAEQHRKYAAVYGYAYKAAMGQFVPTVGWEGQVYMNKIFVLMQVMLEEMARDDPVDWIMFNDADTLIVDPAINIHEMLPPNTTDPEPLILASQDLNGFNAGVMFWPLEYTEVNPSSSDREIPRFTAEGHYPSDQESTQIILRNYKDARDGFYEIPQMWYSSYNNPVDFPNTTMIDDSEWKARGQVHMAGNIKWEWDWSKYPAIADAVYDQAKDLRSKMLDGVGLDEALMRLPTAIAVREEAERWWNQTRDGVDGVTWNEI